MQKIFNISETDDMFNQIFKIIEDNAPLDQAAAILRKIKEKDLVALRSSVKKFESDNWSLLHIAAHKGNLKICKLLIEDYGFDAHNLSTLSRMPLHLACISGFPNLISYLITVSNELFLDCYKKYPLEYYVDCLSKLTEKESDYLANIAIYHKALREFKKFVPQLDFSSILRLFQGLSENHKPAAKSIFRSLFSRKQEIYIVVNEVKPCCPRKYTETIQMPINLTLDEAIGKRHIPFIEVPYFLAQLKSKKTPNLVKYEVDLGKEHIILRNCLPTLGNDGNCMVASFAVLMKISNSFDNFYHTETLPLFIPNGTGISKPTLNFDDISNLAAKPPYEVLKSLYILGVEAVNGDGVKHGHDPCFDCPKDQGQAQYIKHTEQALAAFLCFHGGEFLLNQLIDRLRKNSITTIGSNIKIISVFLQLHSTKTPCAVCEYVLIGLQQTPGGFINQLEKIMDLFTREYNNQKPSRYFKFCTPKGGIKLQVLYSANDKDADHRKNLEFKKVSTLPTISIKIAPSQLLCSVFKTNLPNNINTSNETRSLLFSGGAVSDKTRNTKFNVQRVINIEQQNYNDTLRFASLTLS